MTQVTKISTYDIPACLAPKAPAALAAAAPVIEEIPLCKWKEYTSPDGKKYYSDGKNSLWEEPEELR